jgi:hypothetical protein
MPKLSISGSISPAALGFTDNITPRIFMAAIVECLREALHHAEGERPVVHIELVEPPDCRIVFTNPCALPEVPAALRSGNQSAMLNQLHSHLDGWTIGQPEIRGGYWQRSLNKSAL